MFLFTNVYLQCTEIFGGQTLLREQDSIKLYKPKYKQNQNIYKLGARNICASTFKSALGAHVNRQL